MLAEIGVQLLAALGLAEQLRKRGNLLVALFQQFHVVGNIRRDVLQLCRIADRIAADRDDQVRLGFGEKLQIGLGALADLLHPGGEAEQESWLAS